MKTTQCELACRPSREFTAEYLRDHAADQAETIEHLEALLEDRERTIEQAEKDYQFLFAQRETTRRERDAALNSALHFKIAYEKAIR